MAEQLNLVINKIIIELSHFPSWVEPKFVATLKGQGDAQERAGLTVPVLVTGNLSSPKFRPDLKGMLKGTLGKGIPEPSELKKDITGADYGKG